MELRKKSILIALCIGDGHISNQIKKGKTYQYNYLEISHGQHQGEYIQWKANLCTSVTGRKSNVRRKKYKAKKINGIDVPESLGYTFVNTSPYFRILRKWLYPNNKKKLSKKMISYLDELGLAIWYMDDGCTYVSKTDRTFTDEISTHIPENDAQELIDLFKEKWNRKSKLSLPILITPFIAILSMKSHYPRFTRWKTCRKKGLRFSFALDVTTT